MSLFGNLRIKEADVNYLVFMSSIGKDSAFTLNLANTSSSGVTAKIALASNFRAGVQDAIAKVPGLYTGQIPSVTLNGACASAGNVNPDGMGLVEATLLNGGSGYAVGDLVKTALWGGNSVSAQLRVTTVGATGAITSFKIENPGKYIDISAQGSVGLLGGSGSSATIGSLYFGYDQFLVLGQGSGYTEIPSLASDVQGGASLVAVLSAALPESAFIEPAITIGAGQVYERSGLVLSPYEGIFVSCSDADALNVHAWGFAS